MAAARFCSECGERLKVKRPRTLLLRSFCPHCSTRFRRIRLIFVVVPISCALIGFAAGHYTSAREPFYFIGTPVDLTANRVAPSADNNGDQSSRGNPTVPRPEPMSASSEDTICGARTKSGKPCKRKVKGGGYCWQHRDTLTPKRNNAAQQ